MKKIMKKLTLFVGFSLLLVAPKTIAKQRGGREYMGKQKQRVATRG